MALGNKGGDPTWELTLENGGASPQKVLGKGIVTGLELMLGELVKGLRKHSLVPHWHLQKVEPGLWLGILLFIQVVEGAERVKAFISNEALTLPVHSDRAGLCRDFSGSTGALFLSEDALWSLLQPLFL